MHIPIIDKSRPTYKVDRIRNGQPNMTDKAKEIEDEDTGEKKLKFKSDGAVVPKPGEDKISTTEETSLLKKLQGKRYTKTLKFIDHGDETGDFVEIDFGDSEMRASGDSRMFETHRSLRMQKVSDLFSDGDNTQLWLAGYLTVLALVTIGAMYFLTTGIEDTVAKAVEQGISAGLSATDQAQNAAQGASGGG